MDNKRNKTNVPKVVISVVSCLLLFSVLFVFIIFRTNYVIDIEAESAYSPEVFERTTVSTIIEETDNLNSSNEGAYGSADEIEALLLQDSDIASKAHLLARAYEYFIQLYSHEATIGILANIYHEGSPARVECLYYSKPDKNGDSYPHECIYANSKGEHLFYPKTYHRFLDDTVDENANCVYHKYYFRSEGQILTSTEAVELFLKIDESHNQPGIGLMQFSGSRRIAILNKYLSEGVDMSNEDAVFDCEIDYIYWELCNVPQYTSNVHTPYQSSITPEEASALFTKYYLAPSDLDKCIEERQVTATRIAELLESLK